MATLSTEESVVPSEQTERLAGETEDEKLPSRGAPPEKAGENVELNPEKPGGRVEVKTENASGESGELNPAAKEAAEKTAAPAQDDQKLPPEAGRAEEGGRIRPAGCTGTGDKNPGKEMKAERGEESQSSLIIDPVKGKRLGDKSLRRTSLEVSSSDGEPLSRMDSHSEDSISSTLLDMESGVSSGRSTPAEMADQTSAASSSSSSAKSAVGYPCCWEPRPPRCHGNAEPCPRHFLTSPDLAEHIRSVHVDGQTGGVFVCLWRGCKVYNTPSTSQSWLQRHMLTHSGDKPFKCVVGGCSASFGSQGALARHVPTHFSHQSKLANQARQKEESPSKAGLNRKKKMKNKRRRSLQSPLQPARPHDFFDAQTMEAVRHRAICLNLATRIESLGRGHSVVFHSTVLARRTEGSGKVKVLLHWTPEDILPDAWVSEAERPELQTRVVHLSQLPPDSALLGPNIYRALPQKRLKRSLY